VQTCATDAALPWARLNVASIARALDEELHRGCAG
jgi:hypothetical protein